MGLTIVTPAATSPVSLDEAKAWCSIEDHAFDTAIELILTSAVAEVSRLTGLSLGEQTWQLNLDAFHETIELPEGPVLEVVSLKYLDRDGMEQTVSADDYSTDLVSIPARIVPDGNAAWPSDVAALPNAVRVEFSAGYAADVIPAPLKRAVLTLCAAWFANRESGAVPDGVMQAIEPFRTAWICA